MAATNTTTNYGFPLYNESDSTSWADFNKLSTDADAQIKAVADSGGTTSGQVEELTTKVDTLTQTVNAQDAVITQQGTEITNLTNDAATTDEAIDGLQQKANANETNISNLSTQVAGTILPEVEKNTADISILGQSVSTLSTTVSQQGTRITELEGKVPNDLGTQLTTLTNGLDSVEAEIAGGFNITANSNNNYGFSISAQPGEAIIRTPNNAPGLYMINFNLSLSNLNNSNEYVVIIDSPTSVKIATNRIYAGIPSSQTLTIKVSFILANPSENNVVHIYSYLNTGGREYTSSMSTSSFNVVKLLAIN